MDLYNDAPQVARCLDKLHNLFTQEAEQGLVDHIDNHVGSNANFTGLMSDTLLKLGEPLDLFERIKENLSYDPTIALNIISATEEYNIAVTQQIARRILARLPRELRDLVYSFLTPDHVTVCTLQHPSCPASPHVHCYNNKYSKSWHKNRDISDVSGTHPYSTPFPRTERDPDYPHHFWTDAAMGVDKALELIETFYRTTTFCIEADSLTKLVPSRVLVTVLSDRFRLGLPSADWISHIKLGLHIRLWTGLTDEEHACQDKMVSSWIEVLSSRRENVRIEIMLHVDQIWREIYLGETSADTLNRLMERMLPDLVNLRRDRPRFTLTYAKTASNKEIDAAVKRWVDRYEVAIGMGVDCVSQW